MADYVRRNVPEAGGGRRHIRLRQVGEMQLKPGRWFAFDATQGISLEHVAFHWRAWFPIVPLFRLRVDDWYEDGDGALEARLWGVLRAIRASGADVARGEAMRYLAELPWAPTAMLQNRELEWREVEPNVAEVSADVAGACPRVLLQFGEDGDVVRVTADKRPRLVGKRVIETPFVGEFSEYASFGAVRVPTRAEVSWQLPDGAFTYFRGTVTALETE